MILYAILGLLFIVMVVLAVLSARKDWHWLNPVLLVFIFLSGSAGMIGMAQTLHLRRKALSAVEEQLERATRFEAERQQVIFGEYSSAEYGPESLRGLSQQIELMKLGRGREWSGGTVTNNNGPITFTFPAEQPDVDNDNMSLERVELFAFADQDLTVNGNVLRAPVSFVGKFLVTEQTNTELTLVPSLELFANFEEYSNPQAVSWTLFERMPFDRHGVFREIAKMDGDNFNIAQFRQFLIQVAFNANQIGMDPSSAQYELLIDQFNFDGLTIGEILAFVEKSPNRVSPRFEPDPSEVFVRYKFGANSSESYTVDDKSGKLDTDGPFSRLGHAIDPLLQLSPGDESREVTFSKDDVVEVDLRTAEGYERPDGTVIPAFTTREPSVTEVDRTYYRKLIDFPYELTKLSNRSSHAENETSRITSNNEVQTGTLGDLVKQQQSRLREIAAYQDDNKLLQNDQDRIIAFGQELEQQVAENRRKIDSLKVRIDEARRNAEFRAQQFSSSTR